MESKLQKALSSLKDWEDALACPLCGRALKIQEKRLVCSRGHSWDVNRRGYVNLLSRPHATYYDEALFAARGRVFAAGFYEPVAAALGEYIKPGQRVLDAGCGEGYYLDWLAGKLSLLGAGIDISRPAIQQAACHERSQAWWVGDVTRLPFAPGSLDAILDILTPASYQAFRQALKPGGYLLKVYPGGDYLKELRGKLGFPPYAAGEVEAYAARNARWVDQREIRRVYAITPQQYRDFVWMTPLTQHLTEAEKLALSADPAPSMTLHLTLAVLGQKL